RESISSHEDPTGSMCRGDLRVRKQSSVPLPRFANMITCCSQPSKQEPDDLVLVHSVITCPHCGTAKRERMPVDACRIAYECSGCHVTLRRRLGDCCVFCSYGSIPCPPVQDQCC